MKTIIELWMSSWVKTLPLERMQFLDASTRNGQWMRVTTHIHFNKHPTLLLDSNKQFAHSFHVAICSVFGFVCLLVAMSIIKIISFFHEKESLL
jgi:hypothetical protein